MRIEKVLIVDDEEIVCEFLKEALARKGIDAVSSTSSTQAMRLIEEQSFDLIITDMKMPKITGLDIVKKVKELSPSTLVVVVTAYGSVDNAVETMRLGAYNYLLKPFSPEVINAMIDKANEHLSLVAENHYLRSVVSPKKSEGIIGESPAIKQILSDAKRIAASNASVFISGESGTGKEVIAQAIHSFSPRLQSPFVKVNCAAVAETLIESEFFGHEKGAFTGATARRLGRFELANHGTLLLDEISEIPLSLQAKLLRVTQEQEFERVGGNKPIKIDVRLISTSNRDIDEMIKKKVMREDLFYRLNVIPIHIPPLRERKEDIIPLAEHFLEKVCLENHKKKKSLSPEAKEKLLNYPWPGNVRELSNIIERAVVIMDDASSMIKPDLLSLNLPPKGANLPSRHEEDSCTCDPLIPKA